MSSKQGPSHVVVDGSNIATEGRSMPSLHQLQEAVMGFMEEYPEAAITVVVDATFGHRIDKKERKEYDEAVANNELVAPPAGAVGRGDAFVLGIADKAGATVLSNDSFQEFHGEYEWLFDEGRLIGGKPVPHVGWVWVDRVPVRGPVSRKATRSSKQSSSGSSSRRGSKKSTARKASAAASEPMPVPSAPPPRAPSGSDGAAAAPAADGGSGGSRKPAPKGHEPVNELMPFLDFVEHHPVGTSVNGTVDAYSSHGAYVTIGDSGVRGYVPLRLMADPPPRSAKQVMKIGESVTLVVVSFAASRRSIDCAMPDLAATALSEASASDDEMEVDDSVPAPAPAATPDTKTRTAKKRAARKTAAKKTAAKKAATKKTAATKTAAKKSAGRKTAATKKTAAKKTATKKSAATKTGARKTPAKKTASRRRSSRSASSGSASSGEA